MLERLTRLWSVESAPIYSKLSEEEASRHSLDSVAQEELRLLQKIRSLRRWLYCSVCISILLFLTLGAQIAVNTRWSWLTTTSPVPSMPRQSVRFEKSALYASVASTESDRAWASLLPPGKGFINVDNPAKYDLPRGVNMKNEPGHLYNVAAFHQLYCLTNIREYLAHMKFASDKNQTEQLRPILLDPQEDHVFDCFDYLRQSITCAGDMTLEYPDESQDGQRIVNGWGVSHQCVNWDAVLHYTQVNGPTPEQ